jgi:hypothetical protein
MKALLVIIYMGGHDWIMHSIWFADIAACERAKLLIVAQFPISFEALTWFGNRNKATCIEVSQ